MEQAKTELQLTRYQNKAITDTLYRFVAEQVRLSDELPAFRRALIDECLAMNAKTDHAVLGSATPDGQEDGEPVSIEASKSSTHRSFAKVLPGRRKISLLLITPMTAEELVFQLPLTIDCLVEQAHLPKPLLEFLTWCAFHKRVHVDSTPFQPAHC